MIGDIIILKNYLLLDKVTIIKKTILCFMGTALIACGATIFLKSRLGSDPVSVWFDGLHVLFNTSYGNASTINNLVTLLVVLLFARRYVFVGTIINALLTGPMMNFFDPYIDIIFSTDPTIATRLVMIIIGEVVLCAGVALTLSANFGYGMIECLITAICDKAKWQYKYVKIASDALYTIFGVLLGGIAGIGTIMGVVVGGPVISEIKRLSDMTILKWIGLGDSNDKTASVSHRQ